MMAPKHAVKENKAKPDYAAICNAASGLTVQKGFNQLGPINKFEDLLCPAASPVPGAELAAEQVFHMIEGWRYASAASNAYLNHSKHTALHFAYYAELRAALSLLSWSGIRVRQNAHYYLDVFGNKKTVIHSPTHSAVWGLWKNWVKRPDATKLFRDQIKLTTSVSLSNVLTSLQYVDPSKTLQNWGMDLAKIQSDHTARNTSSYEAFWINSPLSRMSHDDLDLILMLWKLLLPQDSGLLFDSTLISYFVSKALPAMTLRMGGTSEDCLKQIVGAIVTNTGADPALISRRLDTTQYKTKPFDLASSQDSKTENVLCRAFFLLRLSMLATKTSLAVTPNTATADWLTNWFEHAGLWDKKSGVDAYDTNEDYELALDHFNATPVVLTDLWAQDNLKNTVRLTRPEACMVWNVI